MGSIVSLLVVLAVIAGIGLVIFAAVRAVGSPPDKPWEGYQRPSQDAPDRRADGGAGGDATGSHKA